MSNHLKIVRVKSFVLYELLVNILLAHGVSEQDAKKGADVLVETELCGHHSHGAATMFRNYLRDYKKKKGEYGWLNPTPCPLFEDRSKAVAHMDADNGLGLIVLQDAMLYAIKLAKSAGIGIVTVNKVGHSGMMSYYAKMAIEYGMIGVAMTSAPLGVLPAGGAEHMIGTNPIAVAVPAGTLDPFVLDMTTAAVTSNGIKYLRKMGELVPGGVLADAQGVPIMTESVPPASDTDVNILPFGSTLALGSHKGFGLAMVVEVLAGLLSGAGASARNRKSKYAHTVMAINIDTFVDVPWFKETMDAWLTALCASKPAKGVSQVRYPGQGSAETRRRNLIDGIPIDAETIEKLKDICKEYDISWSLC